MRLQGNFRPGLAELMVIGRPVHESPHELTILPHPALTQAFPAGSEVDVVVIERVTDFFLGLNAGQWLKIRIAQISDGGLACLRSAAGDDADVSAFDVLEGTSLRPIGVAEPPPTDASHLHHFYGNFASNFASDERDEDDSAKTNKGVSVGGVGRGKTDEERMAEALAQVRAGRFGAAQEVHRES